MTATIVGTVIADPRFSTLGNGGRPDVRTRVQVIAAHPGRDNRTMIEFAESSRISVACAGALAANVVAQVRAGDRLIAVGRLRQRSWRRADGAVRSELVLLTDECGVALSTEDAWQPDEQIVASR